MKAIWTGSIGFGLVNIPVKIFSAVNASQLDLDMLDKKNHANIKFQRVNANTGKEVTWENIVKGYKLDEKYVVLTDEDFDKASPEKTKQIEINEFVEESDIDSIYYEQPYYLQPQKSGVKAYALLRDALKKTAKAGLGSFVMRNKESLVIIKPQGDILLLQKLRFHEEIRDPKEVKVAAGKLKPTELKMATQLIDQLTTKVNMAKYKDTYTSKLLKVIKAKAKGKKVTPAPLRVAHSRSRDLMEQLKASLTPAKKKAS